MAASPNVRPIRSWLLWSAMVVSVIAVVVARRGPRTGDTDHTRHAPPAPPQWPPFPERSPGSSAGAAASVVAPAWVDAVDGRCPQGYPVKVNTTSGIFHVPGGRFYDRTRPDRCYASTADAEADGYRAAKA